MKRIIRYSPVLAALLWMGVSCKHPSEIPPEPAISFSQQVQPIIIGNCTRSGCHGQENPEEFQLLTYDDVMANGEISPGNSDNSKLYRAITARGEDPMPPDRKLSEEDILTIYIWIQQGAKNN